MKPAWINEPMIESAEIQEQRRIIEERREAARCATGAEKGALMLSLKFDIEKLRRLIEG